ncbi:MAG: hypothetical protein ABI307_06690 [Mycobacterium sp.]
MAGAVLAAGAGVVGLAGCSALRNAEPKVGDCLQLGGPGGTSDRSSGIAGACGAPETNFHVVAVVDGAVVDGRAGRDRCPTDVDSSYTMRNMFGRSDSTACLDVDWVVGGCMSVDPETDPVRVDCNDPGVLHRQRATQVLAGVADADQCASGLGYAYDTRRFTVCVENVN